MLKNFALPFPMLLLVSACMSPPGGLDVSLTRPTVEGRYVVSLRPLIDPIAVNQIHSWEINLNSASGVPVPRAEVDVRAGMPQHGHGSPTRPRVTQDFGDGRYLLEGMKFSMTGWWEIRLDIRSPIGADKVTFNTVIEQPLALGARGDDRWNPEEKTVLSSLRISQLAPAPGDASNAYEALPLAAGLGKRLFGDSRFSANNSVSCSTCHDPGKQFQDGRPVSQGVGTGSRRAMPVVGGGYSPWLFWDGRKDSLWAQALGPLEDSVEHGGNRSAYAHLMRAHYREEYEAVFGPMPDLTGVPENAGPNGSKPERMRWKAMDETARRDVSRIFANMGKAIAAYEKTLRYGETRMDRYIEGVLAGDQAGLTALTPEEKRGLRLFIGEAQCATCHGGPLLTDQHFHNTGVPARDPANPDRGRAAGIAKVRADEFNCLGHYSDAKPESCVELRFIEAGGPLLEGAFKTPSLRNVALRPPYMHAGQIASLRDVVRHYVNAPQAAIGRNERKPLRLTEDEARSLVAFLGTLSGAITEDRVAPAR